ncbi:MAG: RHS repeat-associated core domain-containing protein, partial [Campylobacteraceae bacterium]|nr:RHS repeat-associated core domain-containing protein [Campylobacteraceae bacterium]
MTSQSLNTNIKTIQERTNDKVLTYEYMYDTLNRLIRVTKNNQITEEYSYDNQGNRLSSTINGQTTTASYNSEDQLLTYGNNIYSYDNDGRLMKKQNNEGITSYKYDAFGNLKEVILPNSDKITYMYNANNQRTVKLINNQTEEKYLWLDQITLLAVYDKDNNIKYRFTYTNERTPISYTDKESNVYYLSYNHQGSLKAITNQSNQIVKSIDYDSFGNILEEVYYDGNGNVIQNNPTLDIPIGFAGGLYDKDTKLIKFGYREYDSNTGRWTSKDPIDFGGGSSNLYGYVLGDPV